MRCMRKDTAYLISVCVLKVHMYIYVYVLRPYLGCMSCRVSVENLIQKYTLSQDLLDQEVSEEHLQEVSRIIEDHEIVGLLSTTNTKILPPRKILTILYIPYRLAAHVLIYT